MGVITVPQNWQIYIALAIVVLLFFTPILRVYDNCDNAHATLLLKYIKVHNEHRCSLSVNGPNSDDSADYCS